MDTVVEIVGYRATRVRRAYGHGRIDSADGFAEFRWPTQTGCRGLTIDLLCLDGVSLTDDLIPCLLPNGEVLQRGCA